MRIYEKYLMQKDVIKTMREEGKTYKEISKIVGIDASAISKFVRDDRDINIQVKKGRKKKKLTENQRSLLIDLFKSNYSLSEAAHRVDMSVSTLTRLIDLDNELKEYKPLHPSKPKSHLGPSEVKKAHKLILKGGYTMTQIASANRRTEAFFKREAKNIPIW